MVVLTLMWLLLLTVTGFRVLERELRQTVEGKHYVARHAIFASLLTGMCAFLLVAVTCAVATTLIMVIAPDQAHSVWIRSVTVLGRLVPITSTTTSMAVVTAVLLMSFLSAPLLRPALGRVHKWAHLG